MKPRDKFEWLYLVLADKRIKDGEARALTRISLRHVMHGSSLEFRISQKMVAGDSAVSQSTVSRALNRALELDYLEQLDDGQQGRPRTAVNVYRLVLPGSSSDSQPYAPMNTVGSDDGATVFTDESTVFTRESTVFTDNSLSRDDDTPKYLTKFSAKEREGQAADAASLSDEFSDEQIIEAEIVDEAEQEPSPYCRAHRKSGYGSSDPCRGCKTARLAHERWQRANLERLIASNGGLFGMGGESSAMKPEDCRRCNGRWVLGPDGEPVEPMIKCRHEVGDDVA